MASGHRDREHLGLLAEVGEIVSLLAADTDLDSFLDRVVNMVAHHLYAEVCSIYLLDAAEGDLVLKATVGLNPESVGKLRLNVGEGLVGRALKELRPVRDAHASRNPDYRHFPESGEDPYESFLAVPILRGITRVGVVVLQRRESHSFGDTEVMTVRALTSQLATAIEAVRTRLDLGGLRKLSDGETVPQQQAFFIKGTGASSGCEFGPATSFERRNPSEVLKRISAEPRTTGSRGDLEQAIARVIDELEEMQPRIGKILPEMAALIFDAHLMMLQDISFISEMYARIEAGAGAAEAVARTGLDYIDLFQASSQAYLREKSHDVADITLRVLAVLGEDTGSETSSWQDRIVIASDLLPSDVVRLGTDHVKGVVLAGGGATSHVAILLRALGIPTVVAATPDVPLIADDTPVLVDADSGSVYINPEAHVLERYQSRRRARDTAEERKQQMRDQTATACGERVVLMANINLLSELSLAADLKAEGIGLYRTEFPFLVRQSPPSEAEQQSVYEKLFVRFPQREITIRTIDVGGDKMLSYFSNAGEANPALGLRSTRFALHYQDLFDQQLRAIFRAAPPDTELRVMFPMIASLDEWHAARARFEACFLAVGQELGRELKRPLVGMMIELPAVVELMDEFCREVDFFSVGTNDFVQYMLAVDRTNERVAKYYQPHHPAVLRGLKRVAESAVRNKVPISVCGEMAHEPRFIRFLLGIGIRTLSLDAHFLPDVQEAVYGMRIADCQAFVDSLLAESLSARTDMLMRADA